MVTYEICQILQPEFAQVEVKVKPHFSRYKMHTDLQKNGTQGEFSLRGESY